MAAGASPFGGSDARATGENIHNFNPPSVPNFSKDFNDLVRGLLQKNCFLRTRWDEVIGHPFWKDILKTRPDRTFEGFTQQSLPNEPRFQQNSGYVGKEKRISTIALPSFTRETLQTSRKVNNISISALIMDSDLLLPPSLVLNSRIENIMMPPFNATTISFSAEDLMAADEQLRAKTIADIFATLRNPKAKDKTYLLSFLIHCSSTEECATALSNCSFMRDILRMATEKVRQPVALGLMLLYASIVHHSIEIAPENLTEASLEPLETLVNESDKSARRAIMAIGEVTFYITRSMDLIPFPKFTGPILLTHLSNKDEMTRHYALRAISNIITQSRCTEIFDMEKLELAVIDFDVGPARNVLMHDSVATCLVNLYVHINTSCPDRIEALLHKLLGSENNSSTTQTIALMLGSITGLLPRLKNQIQNIIQDSSGELCSKALLSCCTAFNDDLDGFVPVSSRFYSVFDKVEKDFPDCAEAIAKWTTSVAKVILKVVQERKDYQLIHILLQALPVKRCRTQLCTKSFEASFGEVLKAANFEDPHAEFLLQMLETSLCHNVCDVMLVMNAVQAIESSSVDNRYLVLRLIADATIQPKDNLVEFIVRTILPRVTAFMKNEPIIQDIVLRMLSNLANADSSRIIPKIINKEALSLILVRIVDNASAMVLALRIVKNGQTTTDTLVEAGLINAVSKAMRGSNANGAIDLLCTIFSTLARARGEGKSAQVQRAIESMLPLAKLAPQCAEMFLESPQAGLTLSRLIYLFTPISADEEVPYAGCFERLMHVIPRVVHHSSHTESLTGVIQTMSYAAKNNKTAKRAMNRTNGFVITLKELTKEGPESMRGDVIALVRELEE
jgi:hypothetical protein